MDACFLTLDGTDFRTGVECLGEVSKPVSYTHLHVYKRQILLESAKTVVTEAITPSMPASGLPPAMMVFPARRPSNRDTYTFFVVNAKPTAITVGTNDNIPYSIFFSFHIT